MSAPAIRLQPSPDISDAARQLGKLGGRPRGSYSSPLARWLRAEVRQKQREGWGRREAFDILANTETPDSRDAFVVTDCTADDNDLDLGARVTWSYWKKLWLEGPNGKPFP